VNWAELFDEFHCRGCGSKEAYRSRPRGVVEKYLLPLLLLRAVRCERCYRRCYVFRTIPVPERVAAAAKEPQSQPPDGTSSDGCVA
jgi:hypothetical protein